MKVSKSKRRLPVHVPSGAPKLEVYDRIVVAFSGGKDSLACLLHLLDQGVPREKIELWHHDVDGASTRFMDWPITPAYCRAVAAHFGVPIYFSWKRGGFLREMLRDGQRTAPISWEEPFVSRGQAQLRTRGGDRGKEGTRLRFPQVSGDLRVRWCSAYLKIDVYKRAITNDPRFKHSKTLVVTGERAEESSARSGYQYFEADPTDRRKGRDGRHVDRWRPVHGWSEEEVWAAIARWGIVPHPAYQLGWGRVSCAGCIFGNADQWASLRHVLPEQYELIAAMEERLGVTVKRKHSVRELAHKGEVYEASLEQHQALQLARSEVWPEGLSVAVDPAKWDYPAGAFGDSTGPT